MGWLIAGSIVTVVVYLYLKNRKKRLRTCPWPMCRFDRLPDTRVALPKGESNIEQCPACGKKVFFNQAYELFPRWERSEVMKYEG